MMLAPNPTDARHLLASCIIMPKDKNGKFLFRTRAYVSRDAGRSWRMSSLPDEDLWDPVVAFTLRRTALFVCLLPPRSHSVFRSEDSAVTWKYRTDLAATDHPMIAVDWTHQRISAFGVHIRVLDVLNTLVVLAVHNGRDSYLLRTRPPRATIHLAA